jgi:ParB/RepB/Spo0J family partition protein
MGNNVINLPLESITLSKTNPRKHFDPELMTELAGSIKTHGVLQPILVRPYGEKFELVVGERRFRASKEAKAKTIPTISKDLTDKEAFELKLIENLQRQDLSEIEEARGYRYMIDVFKYKAEDLAEKIHKSRAYIYGRLKLESLCGKGQKALEKGGISASTGLLIARIPGKAQQEKALEEILEGDRYNPGAMTFLEAKEHIEENYMIRLKGCSFQTTSATLLPKAGPCTTCPKRTGNQQDLYPNTSADVCTDPECFRAKQEAHQLILIEKAKTEGKEVLTGKEAQKHVEYGRVKHGSNLVSLDAKNYQDGKYRSYQQLLGKDCPSVTLIETDEGLMPTVNKKEAEEVLKKKFKWAREADSLDQKQKDQNRRENKRKKIQSQVFKESLDQISDKAKTLVLNNDYWLFLAKSFVRVHSGDGAVQSLVKRREIPYKKEKEAWNIEWSEALLKHMETAKSGELRSIIAELIVRRGGHRDWDGTLVTTYKEACKLYSVDSKKIESELKASNRKKNQPLLK